MKKRIFQFSLAVTVVAALMGCNAGTAEAGATPDQVKAEVAKEDPLQQIRNLNFAPIPPAQRDQQIAAIEQKYNVKREDAMKNLPPPKFDLSKTPPQVPTGK